MDEQAKGNVARIIEERLRQYPHLSKLVMRQMLMQLHTRGVVSIDQVHNQARQRSGLAPRPLRTDPNQPAGDRWDEEERKDIEAITLEYAEQHLTGDEVEALINLTVKREEARDLGDIARIDKVSFRLLADQVQRYCNLPVGGLRLQPSEVIGIRVDLIRRLVNDELQFIGIAKNHLQIRDFDSLTKHVIGSDEGMGRIGGKAGGMFLAHNILKRCSKAKEIAARIPQSYYLRSDVVNDFLDLNGLQSYRNQKYKSVEDVRMEYALIQGVFRNADFPVGVVQQLRAMLDDVGETPLIVRSSSLLEDRFGTAFYGKYASIFLANQGELESRLQILLGAIAEVYASIFAPDPILYRREHNLLDYNEDMAVLIQKVVGRRIGRFFLPAFAGVAFSHNEFPFSPRIQREDGLMRIVAGLGTRAVDRVGADYPRMVPLGQPTARPESAPQEIRRVSQRGIDALDLQENRLRTITLADLINEGEPVPLLDKLVSIYRDGDLYPTTGTYINAPPEDLCLTFDKLLADGTIPARIQAMLKELEAVYRSPVDIEFAHDGERLYLLQCRAVPDHRFDKTGARGRFLIPRNVSAKRLLFTANRFVRQGRAESLEYIVYVDPHFYQQAETREQRIAIGRAVGRINRLLHDKAFVLMGPGRWGSKDLRLGVPVTYADINHAKLLIEIAHAQGDYTPEVSFGTHFFQDLVETGIQYLPLYPDDESVTFRERFFLESTNQLGDLLPDERDLEPAVRVIHVPTVASGRYLTVIMNAEDQQAMGYLK